MSAGQLEPCFKQPLVAIRAVEQPGDDHTPKTLPGTARLEQFDNLRPFHQVGLVLSDAIRGI